MFTGFPAAETPISSNWRRRYGHHPTSAAVGRAGLDARLTGRRSLARTPGVPSLGGFTTMG
ncbi:hypothetical protein [Streptomyces sp. Ag109_O5-1]|uniref:hypothetical protein n=1 Tax=Streptomyces sp. Ag109_O5-1 TaxID=1938851 RepID=UPI000F4D76E6|nr:hypothetical protein [Streptomyces sp. Ag109_O5-1]